MMNRMIFNSCMEQLRIDHNKKWSNEELASMWDYCKEYPDIAFQQVIKNLHSCYSLKVSKIKEAFDNIQIEKTVAIEKNFCKKCANSGWVTVGLKEQEGFKSKIDGKEYVSDKFIAQGVVLCTCDCTKSRKLQNWPEYIKHDQVRSKLDYQEWLNPAVVYAEAMERIEKNLSIEKLVESVMIEDLDDDFVPF